MATSPFAPTSFPSLPAVGGLQLAAAEAGVRYQGRPDLMLAALPSGASIAGTFTNSSMSSAAVRWSRQSLGQLRASSTPGPSAFLVNSGNANAFTGEAGDQAAAEMARLAADAVGCPAENVFVASTGVIGEPLPLEPIAASMDTLASGLAPGNWEPAARAIMTTDTFPKGASAEATVDGAKIQVAGIAKGSGMIAPNMATMLAFVFTDAAIAPLPLQEAVTACVDETFNCITVDSDRSTSDTVLVAATGSADMPPIASASDPRLPKVTEALEKVMGSLARQIVRDGEGVTKFVTIRVTGAKSRAEARMIAFSIANSPLVKTALAGEDPNWGRIVMAVGKSGADVVQSKLCVTFGSIEVARDGAVSPNYTEEAGAAYMRRAEIEIGIDAGTGKDGEATVWTCDLSKSYVEINADYRS